MPDISPRRLAQPFARKGRLAVTGRSYEEADSRSTVIEDRGQAWSSDNPSSSRCDLCCHRRASQASRLEEKFRPRGSAPAPGSQARCRQSPSRKSARLREGIVA